MMQQKEVWICPICAAYKGIDMTTAECPYCGAVFKKQKADSKPPVIEHIKKYEYDHHVYKIDVDTDDRDVFAHTIESEGYSSLNQYLIINGSIAMISMFVMIFLMMFVREYPIWTILLMTLIMMSVFYIRHEFTSRKGAKWQKECWTDSEVFVND